MRTIAGNNEDSSCNNSSRTEPPKKEQISSEEQSLRRREGNGGERLCYWDKTAARGNNYDRRGLFYARLPSCCRTDNTQQLLRLRNPPSNRFRVRRRNKTRAASFSLQIGFCSSFKLSWRQVTNVPFMRPFLKHVRTVQVNYIQDLSSTLTQRWRRCSLIVV